MRLIKRWLALLILRTLGPGPDAWDAKLQALVAWCREDLWTCAVWTGVGCLFYPGPSGALRACAFFLLAQILRPRRP